MRVGPCIPVGIQLEKAEVGPTSGPTWRLSHLGRQQRAQHRAEVPAEHEPIRGRRVIKPRPILAYMENHYRDGNWHSRVARRPRLHEPAPLVDDRRQQVGEDALKGDAAVRVARLGCGRIVVTEYVSASGMKRMGGGAKRQCGRALHAPRLAGRSSGRAVRRRSPAGARAARAPVT